MKNASATTHSFFTQKSMLAWFCQLIILAAILLFNFRLFITDGPSMEPTYTAGNCVIGFRLYGEPQTGDVVFLEYKNAICMKRVTFVAGEDVAEAGYDGYWGSSIVPEGYVYVLGDNAQNSMDSRDPDFGLVKISDIWGKAIPQRQKGVT